MDQTLKGLIKGLDTLRKCENEEEINNIRLSTKQAYDFIQTRKPKNGQSNVLSKLYVDGLDSEQICQQVELLNNDSFTTLVLIGNKLETAKKKLILKEYQNAQQIENDEEISKAQNLQENLSLSADEVENFDDIEEQLSNEIEMDSGDSGSDDEDFSDKGTSKDSNNLDEDDFPIKNFKPSVVDDEFFKLNEMNDYLLSEEKQIDRKASKKDGSDSEDDDEIDYFEDCSDDDEEVEENDKPEMDKEKYPRYKDFFRQKEPDFGEDNNKRKFDDTDWQDREENVQTKRNLMEGEQHTDKKSSLELIEERRQRKMKMLEEGAVGEKAWHMKGEVRSEDRPLNSALEEVLQFDITSRPAPVITEETNKKLEDIIKQRIKDKAYDDVVRKEKPVETPLEFKKKLTLNQEKSKESLAQIYEKEYVKQREALNVDPDKPEDEPPLFNELRVMQHDLFKQLDALTNFRFTPRPAVPELKIVSNLPAINMEEVAPVGASDAMLLAPEEIKRKAKGALIGKAERTSTDRNRERRKKKKMQKFKAKQNVNKGKSLQKKEEIKKNKKGNKVT